MVKNKKLCNKQSKVIYTAKNLRNAEKIVGKCKVRCCAKKDHLKKDIVK